MKKNRFIYIVLLLLIFSTGCRKKVVATDIDSSEYGWLLYEQGKYIESNSWFINAVIQDSMFSDGYNGLGWSYGQIGEIDSSISSFSKGIIKASTDSSWSFKQLKLLYFGKPHRIAEVKERGDANRKDGHSVVKSTLSFFQT